MSFYEEYVAKTPKCGTAAKRAQAGVIWSEDFNTAQNYDGIVVVDPLAEIT